MARGRKLEDVTITLPWKRTLIEQEQAMKTHPRGLHERYGLFNQSARSVGRFLPSCAVFMLPCLQTAPTVFAPPAAIFPCVGQSRSRFAPRWRIPIDRFILCSLPSFSIIRCRCIMPLTTSRFSAWSTGFLRNTCILSHLLHEFRRLIPDPNADTVFFYFVDFPVDSSDHSDIFGLGIPNMARNPDWICVFLASPGRHCLS